MSSADFKEEVKRWAQQIGVKPTEIHLRRMSRKWGSCSTSGRLTFSTELLGASEEIRNGAIVHELLHLRVPNHGPLFRNLEQAYLSQAMESDDSTSTPKRSVNG